MQQSIHNNFIKLSAKLTANELNNYFKLYVQAVNTYFTATTPIVKLLDELYLATNKSTAISDCLEAADDAEQHLALNYIRNTQCPEKDLRTSCLAKIKRAHLSLWIIQLMTNGEFDNPDNIELITAALKVLLAKILLAQIVTTPAPPQNELNQIADAACSLANKKTLSTLNTLIMNLAKPEQCAKWLLALRKSHQDKTIVLPYFLTFIKDQPRKLPTVSSKVQLILSLVNDLSAEELLALYLLMVKEELKRGPSIFSKNYSKIPTSRRISFIY